MEIDKKEGEPKVSQTLSTRGELVGFAYEVGSAIAVPLVILALSGRYIDKTYGTSPLFLVAGLLLSLVSTSYIIYKKVKKII